MLGTARKLAKRWIYRFAELPAQAIHERLLDPTVIRRLDAKTEEHWRSKASTSANPLLAQGRKFLSQNDEDGITLEVLRRLDCGPRAFIEVGVGNGLECNSLILLMHGWRGLWFGNEPIAFETRNSGALRFVKGNVSAATFPKVATETLQAADIRVQDLALVSVDIDSFDLPLVASMLASGIRPEVLLVEYNAKFPLPVRFSVSEEEARSVGSDYSGASHQSWIDLLVPAGYRLVACNVTGVNAWFVREAHGRAFADVPQDPQSLYMPADYNWFVQTGHRTSPRTIEHFLRESSTR